MFKKPKRKRTESSASTQEQFDGQIKMEDWPRLMAIPPLLPLQQNFPTPNMPHLRISSQKTSKIRIIVKSALAEFEHLHLNKVLNSEAQGQDLDHGK